MTMQKINRIIMSKQFKPTYLYIKTHNITGLKYLGKTTRDPFMYQGSGLHWTNHINVHGYDVTTELLNDGKPYENENEFKTAAIEFSLKNNIVESKDWANLKIESGDGGDTSLCENYQRARSTMTACMKKKRWWNNGSDQCFSEFPPDETYVRGRGKFNNIGAKMGSDIQRNKTWVNNGTQEMMIHENGIFPSGYVVGRLKTKAFAAGTKRHSAKGSKWWNNGQLERMSINAPDSNWIRGRLPKSNHPRQK